MKTKPKCVLCEGTGKVGVHRRGIIGEDNTPDEIRDCPLCK